MQERVSIIEGKKSPILFIAPHGADDDFTGELAQSAAESIRAYAVINWGFERDDRVDVLRDRGNCNDVRHVQEDVVREEFLNPILRYCVRIQRDFEFAQVFMLHGMGTQVDGDVVIGWGAGSPDSHTCPGWQKNLLGWLLQDIGFKVFEGKSGGKFSGWSKWNLNQLWRRHPEFYDGGVYSMQLEIAKKLRQTASQARLHGEYLAAVCEEMTKHKSFYKDVTLPRY